MTGPTSEDKKDEKIIGDELRLLYSSCVSEIASFKQQQWHVTNYALLLYAAIVGIPRVLDRVNQVEYFVLFGAEVAVVCAAWYVLGMLDESITIRRERQTEIRKKFTGAFMGAWRRGKSESEAPDIPSQKPNLLWFFRILVVVGFFATSWLLARHACAI